MTAEGFVPAAVFLWEQYDRCAGLWRVARHTIPPAVTQRPTQGSGGAVA